MRGVGLDATGFLAAGVVEFQHGFRVAGEGRWRRHVFNLVFRPDAVLVAEGAEPRFRRQPGTGKDDNALVRGHGRDNHGGRLMNTLLNWNTGTASTWSLHHLFRHGEAAMIKVGSVSELTEKLLAAGLRALSHVRMSIISETRRALGPVFPHFPDSYPFDFREVLFAPTQSDNLGKSDLKPGLDGVLGITGFG